MALLIDGYNLLHVTGIVGRGSGPGMFQRSREALVRFLAASLDRKVRNETTVVFDAAEAPPGLPSTLEHDGMEIRYARDYPDADALIEELIQQHNSPRRLLVVSSDHRIQRAARRRRAQWTDSDVWYDQLWQHRAELRRQGQLPVPEKPMGKLSAAEIEYWVNEFSTAQDVSESSFQTQRSSERNRREEDSLDNPFPPGYGEDLLDSEE